MKEDMKEAGPGPSGDGCAETASGENTSGVDQGLPSGKGQPVKAGRSPALVKTVLQSFLRVPQTGRTGATLMAGRKRRKSQEDEKKETVLEEELKTEK